MYNRNLAMRRTETDTESSQIPMKLVDVIRVMYSLEKGGFMHASSQH
jgi:hypothetical protein